MRLFRKFIKYSMFATLFGLLALTGIYLSIKSELPSVTSLKDMKWQTPMQIFTSEGQLISQFGEKKRIPKHLDEMPQQLIDAILATEDDRFYQHFGIDPIGIARAVFGQITGQNKGGGSTITMQVARNFFLTREVTYIRKIKEIFLSFHIEALLSKDEILELYMNKIELGHRSFGFAAAAQVYYGKELGELTLAQYAVLAGLPKAPSTLNPIRSSKRAKERRSVVLQRMLVSDYISIEEYEIANSAPITGKRHGAEIEVDAPYIAEMAHQEMLERYSKDEAYNSGFKVFTSVSGELQLAAQQSVISNLLSYDRRHGYRGPVKQLRLTAEQIEKRNLTEKEVAELPTGQLTAEEVHEALSDVPSYQKLTPAVVTNVEEQSATLVLKSNEAITLPWEAMHWAREFFSDVKQGPAPKTAHEILQYGDVVFVLPDNEGGYLLSQLPEASAAMVAMSPDDGAIKAAVGGFSFKQSQFNRVTQAERQVGSNIKPFIYSAALERGFTLASIVNDAPIDHKNSRSGTVWRPKNSPPVYQGPIRVRLALAQSKNVVAVRLLRAVGLSNVIDHLSSFGYAPDELPRDESLALGSASLTPLQVATGFATFANGGFLVEPFLIERIEDNFGNVIYQAEPRLACDPCEIEQPEFDNEALLTVVQDNQAPIKVPVSAERAISEQNAFLVTQALNSAIWGADWSVAPEQQWQGTGFRGRDLKRRDIAGKTGTTNEAKDAWFSGYSRHLVATSWIGFDDHSRNLGQTVYNPNLGKNQITGKEFGAKSAQPAWITFMKTALDEYPAAPFITPDGMVSVRIDKQTGKLTNKTDKTSLFEYFVIGTEPKEYVSQDDSNLILDGPIEEPEEELF